MKRLFLLPVIALTLSASPLADENFINQVYLDLLGRPVDSAGVSAGLAFLASNSRQSYALSILDSTEYRIDLASAYYQSYLGRSPKPVEVSGFLSLLGSGGTDQQAQAGVLGSAEYFSDQGSDDANFVRSLFTNLLNRSATSGEVSLYVGLLMTSATSAQVASGVLSTSEYDVELLNGYFEQYLHRPMTVSDNALLLQLESQIRNEQVQSEILGSLEYYTLAQQEQVPEAATWTLTSTGFILLALAVSSGTISRRGRVRP